LKEFIYLAAPGILMLFLENLNMEVLVIMASLLGSPDLLAAQVVVVTIGELVMMVPYGFSLGAVTIVS
jgi:Na+-driven multidrug efflux pump